MTAYLYDGLGWAHFYDRLGEVVRSEKLPMADHAAPARSLTIRMSLQSLRPLWSLVVISLTLLCGCEHRPSPYVEATFVWERDFEAHSPLIKKVGWYIPITNMSVEDQTIASGAFEPLETLSPRSSKTVKVYFFRSNPPKHFPLALRCHGQFEGYFEVPNDGPFELGPNRFIVYMKSDGSIEVKRIDQEKIIFKKGGSIELKSPEQVEAK